MSNRAALLTGFAAGLTALLGAAWALGRPAWTRADEAAYRRAVLEATSG